MDNTKDNNSEQNRPSAHSVSDTNAEPISFFAKDESFVYVYKKTEKLATALYMVTNLFSESEPMKWALRKKVGELLSFMLGYKDTLATERNIFSNSIETRVLEIVSLLEISSRSGLVSSMNFSILKKEFFDLLTVLNTVSETQKIEPEYSTLLKTFFDVTGTKSVVLSQKNEEYVKDRKSTVEYGSVPITPIFKKNNRQSIIIGMLKKKKDVTIKDISEVIRDCSEKTIQRELINLIENGVIEKTGERRWSRYSLKNSNI